MKIDTELASIIPPLTEDEYKGLEASILLEGCRDALVCWGDILIDGHNRYKICIEHNIPFKTVQKDFNSRDEAILWMLQNQLSRRNLSDLSRIEMVRKCEEVVKAQAKKRILSVLKQNTNNHHTVPVNLPGRRMSDARDELGRLAGVSGSTYEHAIAVLDNAPKPVIDATKLNELSIEAAYQITKMMEDTKAEIAKRIQQGEIARKVVAELQQREKELTAPPQEISQPEVEHTELMTTYNETQEVLSAALNVPLKDFLAVLWRADFGDSTNRTVARYRKIIVN